MYMKQSTNRDNLIFTCKKAIIVKIDKRDIYAHYNCNRDKTELCKTARST